MQPTTNLSLEPNKECTYPLHTFVSWHGHYTGTGETCICCCCCCCCCFIIIVVVVSFMQGIHTHIPETNHVPKGFIVSVFVVYGASISSSCVGSFVLLR